MSILVGYGPIGLASEKSRHWILRAGASEVVMVDQLVGEALVVGSFRARSKATAPPAA